ncbi:MAG: hypothetical protein ACREYC_26255 [Gammaproteobacteria bacterium]
MGQRYEIQCGFSNPARARPREAAARGSVLKAADGFPRARLSPGLHAGAAALSTGTVDDRGCELLQYAMRSRRLKCSLGAAGGAALALALG